VSVVDPKFGCGREYVNGLAPVASVVPDTGDVVITSGPVTVAVQGLFGDPFILTGVLVSPSAEAFCSPAGVRTGGASIAMTREPSRMYSFDGGVCAGKWPIEPAPRRSNPKHRTCHLVDTALAISVLEQAWIITSSSCGE
jgi:hypothetical protein